MHRHCWQVFQSIDVSSAASLTRRLLQLSGLTLACLGIPAAGQVSLTVGPNVNITQSSGNNAEETIAVNPSNPQNLFASETIGLVTKYSLDGGLTWSNSNLSGLPSSIGDVSAAFDSFGNLFLVRFGPNLRVAVALSTNGGASFSLVYQTTSLNNDQPTVATGHSSVPGQGSVWVTYTDSSSRLVAQGATVSGLGAVGAFGSVQIASGNGDFGDIAIGPAGQVMVVYQDPASGVGPDTLNINVDPDGFGPIGFSVTVAATTTQVGGFAAIPAQPSRTIDAEAGLAWDCSGGPHNGRVYLVYTDRANTATADTDIYARYSDDNGTTWSQRVRVNDDPLSNGKSQFLPKVALDQATGFLAVSFYDCRNSAGNNTAELWATVSVNGGQTFEPNVKVSGGMSSGIAAAVGSFNFGDYTGLTYYGGAFYPCWADNSNSTGDNPGGTWGALDIYTAKVLVNVPVAMVNPRLANGVFAVSVQTMPGRRYYLQSSEGLVPAVWQEAGPVVGDGTVRDLVDPSAGSPQKFYRVRMQ